MGACRLPFLRVFHVMVPHIKSSSMMCSMTSRPGDESPLIAHSCSSNENTHRQGNDGTDNFGFTYSGLVSPASRETCLSLLRDDVFFFFGMKMSNDVSSSRGRGRAHAHQAHATHNVTAADRPAASHARHGIQSGPGAPCASIPLALSKHSTDGGAMIEQSSWGAHQLRKSLIQIATCFGSTRERSALPELLSPCRHPRFR